jgi:hypothetical protein
MTFLPRSTEAVTSVVTQVLMYLGLSPLFLLLRLVRTVLQVIFIINSPDVTKFAEISDRILQKVRSIVGCNHGSNAGKQIAIQRVIGGLAAGVTCPSD